jgi:hypothetical protein
METVPFRDISPISSAATAQVSVAVLVVITKVDALAVDAIAVSVYVHFLDLLLTLRCMLSLP